MKLFLDTNVVIDYLAKRQPFAEDANRMITWCLQKKYELCLSALSFTIIYYVLKRQYGHDRLVALLSDLLSLMTVGEVDDDVLQHALASEFTDFEDAVQCYAAIACGADVIVTRNVKDFGHSPLLVRTPAEVCDLLNGCGGNNVHSSLVNEPMVPYGPDNDFLSTDSR